jgi:aminoglycoside phosphotransferase (APT) family kinase protein
VPDLRVATLPDRLEELLRRDLPVTPPEHEQLRALAPQFDELCRELAARGIADTIQHDDLHHRNLFVRDRSYRVLDWRDSSISHPFASLVVTFEFLETVNGLPPDDPWFARLADAYLEPRALDRLRG